MNPAEKQAGVSWRAAGVGLWRRGCDVGEHSSGGFGVEDRPNNDGLRGTRSAGLQGSGIVPERCKKLFAARGV